MSTELENAAVASKAIARQNSTAINDIQIQLQIKLSLQ